jgi:hypothetical protein
MTGPCITGQSHAGVCRGDGDRFIAKMNLLGVLVAKLFSSAIVSGGTT